jgi:acetylornithine deacetylase
MQADEALVIDRWIEGHTEELLEFLSSLVQIPSEVKPPVGNELACQQFVEQAYRAACDRVDTFDPLEVPGLVEHPAYHAEWDGARRDLDNRPVVVGVCAGTGGGRSLLLSAHVDTVMAGDPGAWVESAPFRGEIKNGRLYGRGAWDTKWGIAVGLFAARCARECFGSLRGDLIIESVSDEEFGGSHGTLAARLRGYNADAAINAEPTSMVTAPAHRGGMAWKIVVRGDAGRGFAGQQLANPVEKLARIISILHEYDRQRAPLDHPPRFYESDPYLPTYIQQINGGGATLAESIGAPAECSISLWTEEHPATSAEAHIQSFTGYINGRLSREPDFDGVFPEYRQQFRFVPGSQMDPDHAIFGALEKSFASSGLDFRMDGAKFACDTYVFNLFSPTPALTLGPRGGNAHAADEYVLVQDVIDLTRVYARLIRDWCG